MYLFAQDPDTEERKQMLLNLIQRIEQFQIDNQVRPPALKVDSAIAICKKFKDSEEILSLGPSAMIRWRGICHEDCESDGNIYCEYCRYFVIHCPLEFATLDKAAVLPIATSTPVTNLRQYINSDLGYNDLKF